MPSSYSSISYLRRFISPLYQAIRSRLYPQLAQVTGSRIASAGKVAPNSGLTLTLSGIGKVGWPTRLGADVSFSRPCQRRQIGFLVKSSVWLLRRSRRDRHSCSTTNAVNSSSRRASIPVSAPGSVSFRARFVVVPVITSRKPRMLVISHKESAASEDATVPEHRRGNGR